MKLKDDTPVLWICWGSKEEACYAYRYSDESEWHHGDEDERKGQVIDALAVKIPVHHGWCPHHD